MNKMLKLGLILGGSILLAGGSALGTRQWAYSSAANMAKDQTADKDKVLGRLKLAYNLGNTKAASLIGELYRTGGLFPKDQAEAFAWYQKAGTGGDPKGQAGLGDCYFRGQGVTEDRQEALKWYRKAAEQGDSETAKNLAMIYLAGAAGVPVDRQEGMKWLQLGAEHGNADAQASLGQICLTGGPGKVFKQDPAEAVQWFKKAAAQGNPRAENALGEAYQDGVGVGPDPSQAASWFKKAAERGLAEAQFNLGVLYINGKGVERDLNEAMRLMRLAANQGNGRAQAVLGFDLMQTGNFAEALPLLQSAVDQGVPGADEALAECRTHITPPVSPVSVQGLGVILNENGRPRVRGIVQNNGNQTVTAWVSFDLVRGDGVVVEQFTTGVYGLQPGSRKLIDVAIAPYHANTRASLRGVQCR